MNELTFVARLGTQTTLRAERLRAAGKQVIIARGDVEERQIDPATGRYRRCDIRLNSRSGRKLVSGEMKRPEVAEGRDARNAALVHDARRKAVARGLPFYFTCNMAEVVLFSVSIRPQEPDREEASYKLAAITHSSQVDANWETIAANWDVFLDDLETRLQSVADARPPVTTKDVLVLREAIFEVADELIDRVLRHAADDAGLLQRARDEAAATFAFGVALNPKYPATFRDEMLQIIRLGVFVVAQKLVLYRVLAETGPRRQEKFQLDDLVVPRTSTDPIAVKAALDSATAQAIARSGDYETAFLPTPHHELLFLVPRGVEEVDDCRVGEVWANLLDAVNAASWTAIAQNLVGFLYEVIVDPEYRHQLGQHYTREDVVDLLTAFAVRQPGDLVIDPASGGGSFARAAYNRKRLLGESHDSALATTWATEISAFAAELTTISLATADTTEPAAYPRVLLKDFFDLRPGIRTDLEIPGLQGKLVVPDEFDAIIGNPPYISYRHQANQPQILRALSRSRKSVVMPRFSGKSDAYAWFMIHGTSFLKEGGRLAFIVSSALLFSDYGIPLIRFMSRHYLIRGIVDSMVERWFIDAATNTVLVFLERCSDESARAANDIRFVRLRRPLNQLLPGYGTESARQEVEDLVDDLLTGPPGGEDPRYLITTVRQGLDGGLTTLPPVAGEADEMEADDDDGNV
ncbi:class I SAM-dependent DNA methyltransferase [Micromonospora chalcea]